MKRMTVVFHDDDLCTDLKIAAVRQQTSASEIIASAVREWLERQEDSEWLPSLDAARGEWERDGGRPWSEVERDLSPVVDDDNATSETDGVSA